MLLQIYKFESREFLAVNCRRRLRTTGICLPRSREEISHFSDLYLSTPPCCGRNSCYRIFPTAIVFSDCVDYLDLKDRDSCFTENFGDLVACTSAQILKVRINSPPSDSS